MSPRPAAAVLLLTLAASPLAQPDAARAPPPRGDLTLDGALALAARVNADLLAARADADVSRADRDSARAGVLPRLDLTASWGRNFAGASQVRTLSLGGVVFPVGGGPASGAAAYSLGLELSQTLFDWQRFQAIGQARWGATATDRKYDEAALAVAFKVTRLFYDVVKQERSLAVLEKTARRSQELVGRADALFTAGRAPRSDTLSARVNLANDRIAVEAQRARVEQARAALARPLGLSEWQGLAVASPPALDAPEAARFEPPALDELLARARAGRPAFAAQVAQLEAAEAGVSAARAGYLPAVSAQASYSRTGQELTGHDAVYGDPSRAYTATAQVVLSWNLFQGLGTAAQVRRAEGSLAGARAAREGTAEAIAEEVASARAAVVSLARQSALAAENLDTARRALSLATERFTAGLASQLEERDASLKLSQAELTLLQTRIDHAVAVSDLSRAVGGTF